jgi:nucleoid-associated protein YgaU
MAASRPINSRVAVAAALGLAATGLIAFAALRDGDADETVTAAVVAPAPTVAPPAPEPSAPTLDLVRVEPDGAAMLAGRAAPGALVAVRAGETVLATAEADASGAFVATFDAAPDGPRDLVLATQAAPEAALALTLPEPEGGFAPAAPRPEPAAETLAAAVAAPAAEAVAAPEAAPATPEAAPVEVAVAVAVATPAPAPAVSDSAPQPEAPQTRITQSAPLPRPAARPAGAGAATVVVQPGGTLWTLAREHYGAGRRYPVIVSANAEEIADPALIFPGQRLVLPPARSD